MRVIRDLKTETPLEFIPTFLGAHAVPEEHQGDPQRYVEIVINEMLPAVAAEQLAEYCDIFCERGYFDVETARRILSEAQRHGLRLRMHVDQLTNSGGARLAAELGAATADHLEQTEDDGIAALRACECSTGAVTRQRLCVGQVSLPAGPRYDRCRSRYRPGDGFQSRFIADAFDPDDAFPCGHPDEDDAGRRGNRSDDQRRLQPRAR